MAQERAHDPIRDSDWLKDGHVIPLWTTMGRKGAAGGHADHFPSPSLHPEASFAFSACLASKHCPTKPSLSAGFPWGWLTEALVGQPLPPAAALVTGVRISLPLLVRSEPEVVMAPAAARPWPGTSLFVCPLHSSARGL